MNPMLAKLYGLDKTASAAAPQTTTPAEGAQNGDALDITKLTDEQLNQLYGQIEAAAQEKALEKMASDGTLRELDLAGRTMAHAMFDELQKIASAGAAQEGTPAPETVTTEQLGEEIEVDASKLTADDIEFLKTQGFEEVVDQEQEKVASRWEALKGAIKGGADKVADIAKTHPKKVGGALAAGGTAAGAMAFRKFRRKQPAASE